MTKTEVLKTIINQEGCLHPVDIDCLDCPINDIECIPSRRVKNAKRMLKEIETSDAPETPAQESSENKPATFEQELRSLLNRYSKENGSNTPDFILAEYLVDALENYNKAVSARERWYGRLPNLDPQRIVNPRQTRSLSRPRKRK